MVQAEIMKFSQLALVSRSVELSKNLEKGTKWEGIGKFAIYNMLLYFRNGAR